MTQNVASYQRHCTTDTSVSKSRKTQLRPCNFVTGLLSARASSCSKKKSSKNLLVLRSMTGKLLWYHTRQSDTQRSRVNQPHVTLSTDLSLHINDREHTEYFPTSFRRYFDTLFSFIVSLLFLFLFKSLFFILLSFYFLYFFIYLFNFFCKLSAVRRPHSPSAVRIRIILQPESLHRGAGGCPGRLENSGINYPRGNTSTLISFVKTYC